MTTNHTHNQHESIPVQPTTSTPMTPSHTHKQLASTQAQSTLSTPMTTTYSPTKLARTPAQLPESIIRYNLIKYLSIQQLHLFKSTNQNFCLFVEPIIEHEQAKLSWKCHTFGAVALHGIRKWSAPSNVTDISGMFYDLSHNKPLVSNVTDMSGMFYDLSHNKKLLPFKNGTQHFVLQEAPIYNMPLIDHMIHDPCITTKNQAKTFLGLHSKKNSTVGTVLLLGSDYYLLVIDTTSGSSYKVYNLSKVSKFVDHMIHDPCIATQKQAKAFLGLHSKKNSTVGTILWLGFDYYLLVIDTTSNVSYKAYKFF